MEDGRFIAQFTEADMALLLSAPQATLNTMYGRVRELAQVYDRVTGDFVSEDIPLLGEDGSLLLVTATAHIFPARDANQMYHGATIALHNTPGDERVPVSTYEIWWKPDAHVDSDYSSYFELRSGSKICGEEAANRLLGYILPDASAPAA